MMQHYKIDRNEISSTHPDPTISITLISLLENAMALGGVATGSMKAKEAETVAVTIRYNGFILVATAYQQ